MSQRITKILTADVQRINCTRPFCVVWFDRLSRPGSYVFELERRYSLEVDRLESYRLTLDHTHTLRAMNATQGTLPQQATEGVTVWAKNVTRENAKALDAIRHAQVAYHYDPDAPEDYLVWRRIYPQTSPANEISERWDYVQDIALSFTYDPVFNF